MSEPFGPFREDVDPIERIAQLRVLRALVHQCAIAPRLETALREAEKNDVALITALALIDALQPIPRRRILSTFAYVHQPLYSSARTQPKKGTANAYVE